MTDISNNNLNEVSAVHDAFFRSGLISHDYSMVDVGACEGASFEEFLRQGWKVFALEPDPSLCRELLERFGMWRTFELYPVAASATSLNQVELFSSNLSKRASSLVQHHHSQRFSEYVVTRRLDELQFGPIDLLKIDAQGGELGVLRGLGLDRPKVIVTKFDEIKASKAGTSTQDLCEALGETDYEIWVSEWHPPVRFAATSTWKKVYKLSGTVPDTATYGNLIAVNKSSGVSVQELEEALAKRLT